MRKKFFENLEITKKWNDNFVKKGKMDFVRNCCAKKILLKIWLKSLKTRKFENIKLKKQRTLNFFKFGKLEITDKWNHNFEKNGKRQYFV